jgi:hypothetical protein
MSLIDRGRRLRWVAVALATCALSACAAVLGIEDGILDDTSADAGHDASSTGTTTTTSTTTGGSAGGGAAGSTGAAGSIDFPDAPFDAAACSMRMVDEAAGLFVEPTGDDGFTCGTRLSPCKTVKQGIDRAKATGKSVVYIAPGKYVETINLAAGIALEGGWSVDSHRWSPICTLQASTGVLIQAPPTADTTIVAADLNGSTELRKLSVASKDPTAVATGESLYGIVARGSTTSLALHGVVVTLAPAGPGRNGDAGGSPPNSTQMGCDAGAGAMGATGQVGKGSDGGAFASSGFVPGVGASGSPGSSGDNGARGGSGECQNCYNTCGVDCPAMAATACGQTGLSGCGGPGGKGGDPGGGGGSSIALFAWDAQVTVTDSVLAAGSGGSGGAGGPGAPGGAGAMGAIGATTGCVTGCGVSSTCHVVLSRQLEGGAPGGSGGVGGTGGVGGGGAGGWSCAYYQGGTSTIKVATTTLESSDAGAAGTPAGTPGVSQGGCP